MRMTHQEIENQEIIERYVRHELSADDRRAFQEHFFACDRGFDKAQMMARMIAGVREAAVAGVLARDSLATPAAADSSSHWPNWFKPAFIFATATSVLLAVLLGWLLMNQMPKLRGEIERQKRAQEQLEHEKQELEKAKQQRLESATSELESEREQLAQEKSERAKLQKQLQDLARQQVPPTATAKT